MVVFLSLVETGLLVGNAQSASPWCEPPGQQGQWARSSGGRKQLSCQTPWLRPGGKSNGTDETRLRTGSQFAEMPSSQSLTQLDSVTWHVTRASHVFPQVRCMVVIPGPPYAYHRRHFAFDRTRSLSSLRGRAASSRRNPESVWWPRPRLTRAIPWRGLARKEQRAAPEWQREGGAAKKQTAAPEGTAVWEPPFL